MIGVAVVVSAAISFTGRSRQFYVEMVLNLELIFS